MTNLHCQGFLVVLFVGFCRVLLSQSSWNEWHWCGGICVSLYQLLMGWNNPLDTNKKTAFTGRSCLDLACLCAGAENFMERFSVLYGDKIFVRNTAWSSQWVTTINSCCFLTQLSEEISLRLCCSWAWTTTDRWGWVNSACLCGHAALEYKYIAVLTQWGARHYEFAFHHSHGTRGEFIAFPGPCVCAFTHQHTISRSQVALVLPHLIQLLLQVMDSAWHLWLLSKLMQSPSLLLSCR